MSLIIGIDLGATNIKIGVLRNNKILYRKAIPTREYPTKDRLISALVSNIEEIKHSQRDTLLGVGIGLPGPINYEKGLVHYFPNISGWRNVYLRDIIKKKSGLPVFIDNDANLMALAEARIGAAKNKKNVVGITLGTGVGGGIIADGNLYRGTSWTAGEAGHIPVNITGPRCNCGSRACLERYVGNKYILEKARKIFGRSISLEELSAKADSGNIKAGRIWQETAAYIGIALAGIVNFFNPETIVIGGGVAQAGEVLFGRIREVIKERAMAVPARCVRVVKAKLGNDAGMIGAGILVKESLEN